jgi:hypothetical protein
MFYALKIPDRGKWIRTGRTIKVLYRGTGAGGTVAKLGLPKVSSVHG